jgi:hypothetical protein
MGRSLGWPWGRMSQEIAAICHRVVTGLRELSDGEAAAALDSLVCLPRVHSLRGYPLGHPCRSCGRPTLNAEYGFNCRCPY